LTYEELHRRYGTHVSQRVRRELTSSEFDSIDIDSLPSWLEARAEAAHDAYLRLLNNPLASQEKDESGAKEACRRWREAEDLAYLVVIADDVSANARAL
jgi:hypothetical protein